MKKILLFSIICNACLIKVEARQDSIIIMLKKHVNNQSIQINIDKNKIDSLSKEITFLNRQCQFYIRTNEETISSISNQLSSSSHNLTFFGILFGIAGIGLSVYVTRIERKIVKLNEDGTKLLEQTKDIQSEVNHVNQLIQNDIYGLFEKIKREETIHILNRLVKIPRDIENLNNTLLSRELLREDFELLKSAYLRLGKEPALGPELIRAGIPSKESYLLLFFQHFVDLAIKDPIVGRDIEIFYEQGICSAFENDMIKTTEDFIKAVIDLGIQNKTEDINNFFKGLAKSEFVDLHVLYEIMFATLKTRDARFKFYEIISNNIETKRCKIHFGQLLITEYSNIEKSKSEQVIIDEINVLKTA